MDTALLALDQGPRALVGQALAVVDRSTQGQAGLFLGGSDVICANAIKAPAELVKVGCLAGALVEGDVHGTGGGEGQDQDNEGEEGQGGDGLHGVLRLRYEKRCGIVSCQSMG